MIIRGWKTKNEQSQERQSRSEPGSEEMHTRAPVTPGSQSEAGRV